jgi:ankyrin repeat protein
MFGSRTIVRILLKAGADPNIRNQEGVSTLYFATMYRETHCLQALWEAGADTEYMDEEGSYAGRARGQDPEISWSEL